MPWLTDEAVQSFEDPADRGAPSIGLDVARRIQARQSWEDAKRRKLERDGFAVLKSVTIGGLRELGSEAFAALVKVICYEQPKAAKASLRTGRLDLGDYVVSRAA
jgi:hypothetical protein